MGWPEYCYLALTCAGLGFVIAKHGEPRGGEHDCISSIIATAIILWLLWCGGFFS